MALFERMQAWRMVRPPCVFLPDLPCYITGGALEYGDGYDMLPEDKYVLNVLMAMRPIITNALGGVAAAIPPPGPIQLKSIEIIRYELALLYAHLDLLTRSNFHLTQGLFRALDDLLPCAFIFRDSDIYHWKEIIRLMHDILQAHISLRDHHPRAVQRWSQLAEKRPRHSDE